jgi:hypothetical protein
MINGLARRPVFQFALSTGQPNLLALWQLFFHILSTNIGESRLGSVFPEMRYFVQDQGMREN